MKLSSRIAPAALILLVLFDCDSGHVGNRSRRTISTTTRYESLKTAAAEVSKVTIEKESPCRVVIKFLAVAPGKPPERIYRIRLQITNPRSEPLWFVLRLYGDKALPDSGRFLGYDYKKQPFSSMLYTKKARNHNLQAVVIDFLGENGFTALRLPRGGKIIFDSFVFSAFSEVSDFEIWEVNSLLVNGKTPVENWLPYKVTSDESVHLGEHEKLTSLEWDKKTNNYRQDYPNERVEFVTAHAIQKCVVPLKP